jgi:hypothetical protein
MLLSFRRLSLPRSTLSYIMANKWPELKDVERLSDRVIRILGQNPGKVRAIAFPSDTYKSN